MQSKKNIIKYIILILAISVFIGVFIFSFNDINEILNTLKDANYYYILIGLIMVIVYVCLSSFSIMSILYYKKEKIKLLDSFCICSSEFFFRGVTPFNSGGEPFQIYGFSVCNVKASKSTPIILLNFAIFQVITNILSILGLVIYYDEIYASLSGCFYIVIVGLIVNLGTMILLFFAMSKKMGSLAIKLLKWLSNKKLLKKILNNKLLSSLEQYFTDMSNVSAELTKNWPIIIVNAILKFIALVAYNSIPFFVIKAMGINLGMDQFIYTFMLTIFASTMLIWVPTPGASGGMEYVFTMIFVSLGATGAAAISGMLIWRLLTYYILLIIGFICYLVFNKRRKLYEDRVIY